MAVSRHRAGVLLTVGLLAMTGCGASGGGGGGGAGGGGNGDDNLGGNGGSALTADAGPATQTALLESGATASVTLDAGGSTAPGGGIVDYTWTDEVCGELGSGEVIQAELGAGQHGITLQVTDTSGATATTRVVLTVIDARPATFELVLGVEGAGRTVPAAGAASVQATGSTVTVTAIPDAGWRFVEWTGDVSADTATTTVVMNDNKTVTAVFGEQPAADLPRFHLPWAQGYTLVTGQDNNGTFSHQGHFAWDYTQDIGAPIVAVAAGRVTHVVEDLPNNPPDAEVDPEAPANVVHVDHGGGLQSIYAHLDQDGAAVEPGQLVAAGQYLGRVGNSGYTTGPHLHYEVLDAANNSVSTGFHESQRAEGIAVEGDELTSQNALDVSSLEGFADSTLPVDTFSMNNIELIEPTPPAFFYTTGVEHSVRGRVTDRAASVCMALVEPDTEETVFCEPQLIGPDREFELSFSFPTELEGFYLLGVASNTGTAAPVYVLLRPPVAGGNQRPVVTAEQPSDALLDVDATGTLRASGSDADGDVLTYQWFQVSGPPATIADASAAETTFTLAPGEGSAWVRFQVTVSDGVEMSLPAEVEYWLVDTFHVSDVGVTDEECEDLESCQAASDGTLEAASKRVTLWMRLLNVHRGDVSRYEIRDPAGEVALAGRLCEPAEEGLADSFWRFSWTGNSLSPPGEGWQAVYLRNDVEEAVVPFTLAP